MNKPFDCVEMKNRIQAQMREDEQQFGVAEMRRRSEEWLAQGEDALARWWRTLAAVSPNELPAAMVREDTVDYGPSGTEGTP